MKSKTLFVLLPLLLVLALSACGGSPGPELPDEAPVDQDIPDAAPPICDPNTLLAPILSSPDDQEVDPTYGQEVITSVYYPDAGCAPDGFEREVYDNPGFGGNNNQIINPSPVNLPPNVDGYYGAGQLTLPLDDCSQYFWHARAIVGNQTGPYSETRTFFTDYNNTCTLALANLCDPNNLLAPILTKPTDNEANPNFGAGVLTVVRYPDANCYPEAFARFVAKTPSFSGPGNIFNPSPLNLPPDLNGYYGGGQVTSTLDNCTGYYWRAQALVGNTAGPFSDTWQFFTNFDGNCFVPPQWSNRPYLIAPQDTNCRASDYSASKNLGTLFEGEEVLVMAVNPEATHVRIMEPSFDLSCWVWLGLVDLMRGDIPFDPDQLVDLVSLVDPPDEPAATPTDLPPTDTPVPLPQCSDGIDNDGDGDIDMSDGRCLSPDDNDENG